MLRSRNFIAAAPLIRLQLDNLLRLSAGTLVHDPHKFAMDILEGTPVKKQKDISNNFMTDSYLLEILSKKYSWIKDVYNGTSGYIHLSEKHIINSMCAGDKKGALNFKITDSDAFVTEDDYLLAVDSFRKSTEALFEYALGWAKTKENPKVAAEMIRKQRSKNE